MSLPEESEIKRLAKLRETGLLDTPPEAAFDDLVLLASRICEMPTAFVSLVDEHRQWFKSIHGLEARETSREYSFCAHSLAGDQPFIVEDATLDPIFAENPLVKGKPHIRFYAGVPLILEKGLALGTLAVVDYVPRQLAPAQLEALQILARQVTTEIRLRLHLQTLQVAERSLDEVMTIQRIAGKAARLGGWSLRLPELALSWSNETRIIHEVPEGFCPTLEQALNFYAPADRPKVASCVKACMTDGTSFDLEVELITAKGNRIWAHALGEASRDSEGKIVSVQGAFQDITLRKQAERSLAAIESRLRQQAEVMPFIVWTASAGGEIDFSNRHFFTYTGLPVETDPANHWQACLHPEDLPRCLAAWHAATHEGGSYDIEYRIRRGSDNTYRWFRVQAAPIRAEDGSIALWYGTAIDIDETRRLQMESEQWASRLTETLESITDGFLTVDLEWRLVFINSEARRMLQLGPDVLDGRNLWSSLRGGKESVFKTNCLQARADNQSTIFEFHYPELGVWLEVRANSSEQGMAIFLRDITQQRNDRAQIRLLGTCLSGIQDVVIITEARPLDLPGPRIVYVNEAFEQLTGYRSDEALGQTPRILQGPKTQRAALDRIRAALENGEPVREELINYTKSGRELLLEINLFPVTDVDGELTHFITVERDVTQRKEVERQLRTSEERFRMLSTATNDAIWDWDLATGTLWWNDGFQRLFGFGRGESEPTIKSWTRRIHPEERRKLVGSLQVALKGKGSTWRGDYRFARGDGSYAYVWGRGHIIRDEEGKAIRMIGGMTDLSERRANEERLGEQAALLDNAQDAILVRGLDHRILYWNKSSERLYGWTAQEALGRSIKDLIYRHDAAFEAATAATVEKGEWVGEIEQWTRDGQKLIVEGHWTLVRDEVGAPKSILASNTDITQRKKLEEQFLRAQRMESIGTLAGGIAHDLNNLLSPIVMGVDLLRRFSNDPRAASIISTIEQSAQRGTNLVKQVLSFAKGVEGARVSLQLSHLVREVETIVINTFPKNIQFQKQICPGLHTILGDPTQLNQVILNLCVNARDAMPQGGTLTIALYNQEVDEQYAAMDREVVAGSYVVLEVADEGTGMVREVMNRVFEPFYTTKEPGQGTGLGLPTALSIIRSHGGSLHVYSEPGKGSTFKIYLPATDELESGATSVNEQEPFPRGNRECVLVVDDERALLSITRQTLETFGYRVLTAEDGAQAMAVYVKNRADIAVVLTDMMMPVMDGSALIAALRRISPKARIIATSGLNSNGRPGHDTSAGADHFLAKPYAADVLLKLLRQVISEPT